ncbi:hypothetical protein ACFE04_019688 [Oxalis oulophora]
MGGMARRCRNRSDSNRRIEVLQTHALATWLRFPINSMSFLPCLTLLHRVRPRITDAGMLLGEGHNRGSPHPAGDKESINIPTPTSFYLPKGGNLPDRDRAPTIEAHKLDPLRRAEVVEYAPHVERDYWIFFLGYSGFETHQGLLVRLRLNDPFRIPSMSGSRSDPRLGISI